MRLISIAQLTCIIPTARRGCRHATLSGAQSRVSQKITGQPPPRIISALSMVFSQEEFSLSRRKLPFDDGARQIPGNIHGTGELMALAMADAIALQDALWRQEPFVGKHAAIGENW